MPRGWLGDSFRAYQGAIEGARFDGARKMNVAPLDKVPTILHRLREAGFATDVEPDLAEKLRAFTAQQWLDLQGASQRLETIDAELKALGEERGEKMGLYGFQRVGVKWLATRNAALLADDMGLGKSLSALASLPANTPVLVVCPANAKGVWRREVAKWRPHLNVTLVSGRGNFRWPEKGEVLVVNYDILPEGHKKSCEDKRCEGCAPFLDDAPEHAVAIADEAHALKNSKAQRTGRWRAIANTVRRKQGKTWLLTATPLLNRPPELWSVFQAGGIAQEAFGSWKNFQFLFKAKPQPFGGFTYGTPDEEVEERIRRVMLRRRKDEVAKDLPRKTYKLVDVEVDKKTLALCDQALEGIKVEDLEELLLSGKKSIRFEDMSKVRAALATAKIPALLDVVADYEDAEEPLVVFSAHRAPIDTIGKREGWRTITGDTPSDERTKVEDQFQRGELKGIACTIDAGGVAITLTRACNVVFVDLKWTPGLNSQAEDRVLRIGQKRPVTVTILVANHVLDERVAALLTRKQSMIDASVEAARERPREDGEVAQSEEQGASIPKAEGSSPSLPTEMSESDVEARVRRNASVVEEASRERFTRESTPKVSRFRPAKTPTEEWVAQALRKLDDLNPDQAGTLNGVGFNKIDSGVGRSLRRQLDERGGLSDTQWKMGAQICRKYHRQVGKPPREDT